MKFNLIQFYFVHNPIRSNWFQNNNKNENVTDENMY